MSSLPPVSFVVPVYEGERWLGGCLAAILALGSDSVFEVLIVDDGSTDGTREVAARWARDPRVRLLDGGGYGAAAAINLGVEAATHSLIAQVDQDVEIGSGWLKPLCRALAKPGVAAAQGVYRAAKGAGLLARVAALDLEHRYRGGANEDLDHVCSGTTLYSRDALRAVGGFDAELGYGYDNDLSYRLRSAGYRLVRCDDSTSVHHWPESLFEYLRRQYGVGYGRLQLVRKHPGKKAGDQVSDWRMMVRPPLLITALALALLASLLPVLGLLALSLVGALTLERLWVGLSIYRWTGDRATLWIPPVHLARDLAWAWAGLVWMARTALRLEDGAASSMGRRRRAKLDRDATEAKGAIGR